MTAPKNKFLRIFFYGCKMYSQKSRLEIFSKYDGTFIGSLNTTTLYSLSALCGVLSICLSVFILRSLIDGTPYVKIVLALAFAAIAFVIGYLLLKMLILFSCVHCYSKVDKQQLDLSSPDCKSNTYSRIVTSAVIGAMIMFNILVLLS